MSTPVPAPQAKSKFASWWDQMPAKRRQMVMTVMVIAGVLVFAYFLVGGSGSSGPNTAQNKIDNALLIPNDSARDLGVNGVSADVRDVRGRNRTLESDVARLKAQVDRFTNANGEGANAKEQKLQATIDSMRSEIDQLKTNQAAAALNAKGPAAGAPSMGAGAPAVAPEAPSYGPIRTIGSDSTGEVANGAPGMVPTSAKSPAPAPTRPPVAPPTAKFYLPSGSILQAVLLTGVEAPTGHAAMRDPVPVLARIKHDAILPNFYTADVKECFVLLDTIGDLASERAMMRSETISCVLKDKSVIDVPIQGYGVGEDGKAGLRGKLVSKQGMALRKAMLAGFADGVSKAFGGLNQPSLVSSSGVGSSPNYSQGLESGALGGASSAMDRIAQYYLDLANELHPVVEIESGRQITLVIVRGRTLATVDPNAQAQQQQGQNQAQKNTGGSFGGVSPSYSHDSNGSNH